MNAIKPQNLLGLLVGVALFTVGCTLAIDSPALPISEPAPTLTDGWETLAPGLEMRRFIPIGQFFGETVVLRIDPARYSFRTHYRPGEPAAVVAWRDDLSDAVALINANFFSDASEVVGLLISDGVAYGEAFTTRGGTFGIDALGVPVIRSNIDEPYSGEAYSAAVQGFPMLVLDGEPAYTRGGDGPNPRTAIGLDADGRVLLIVSTGLGLSLRDLSAFLAADVLNLDRAFNLDGGGSSLMSVATTAQSFVLASRDPVPAVLAVYPR
jgi:uncharacterized protein YigE (DUF2233 family)